MTCQIFVILAHKHLQPNCAQGQGFICHLTDYIQNHPSQIAQSQMAFVCNLWIVMDREPDELLRHSGLQSTWILAHLFLLPCHFHLYCVLVWHIWNSPPHTCLSFCLFCVLWLIIFSHRLFLHQVSANFIKSGEFTLERMGVVYKAKAHLKSPFDPENKRVKGIYDWDQTTHVKTDEKHTSYRTAPEVEGFTTFCTSSCFCLHLKCS